MAVLPVVVLVPDLVLSRVRPRRTGFAEILGRGPDGVATVIPNPFVGDQPSHWNHPSCSVTYTSVASIPAINNENLIFIIEEHLVMNISLRLDLGGS